MHYSLCNSKANAGTVANLGIRQSKQGKDENLDVMCNYCKKTGHVKANCFKLMRKNSGVRNISGAQNDVGGTTDLVLSSMTKIESDTNFVSDSDVTI
jgi:hypothetical protein